MKRPILGLGTTRAHPVLDEGSISEFSSVGTGGGRRRYQRSINRVIRFLELIYKEGYLSILALVLWENVGSGDEIHGL